MLDAVNALADVYRKLGKVVEAEALLEKAQVQRREDKSEQDSAAIGAGSKR
jgi:uncharacterized protein HemY